jgi:hypothetical protein
MTPAVPEERSIAAAGTRSGLRLGVLVTVVFVTLKLVGVIGWSWIWVLAPLWIGPVAFLSFLILIGGIAAIVGKP